MLPKTGSQSRFSRRWNSLPPCVRKAKLNVHPPLSRSSAPHPILPGIAKVNPMIGACGISAFPMSSRVAQKPGLQFNPHNHLLIHDAGANTAGQIASVVAGGVMLMLVPAFL